MQRIPVGGKTIPHPPIFPACTVSSSRGEGEGKEKSREGVSFEIKRPGKGGRRTKERKEGGEEET
jgi:hypothetical protein